jgi:hypothetical protein
MTERVVTVGIPKIARPGPPRLLDDGEVHLMLARIRPWDSRENIVAAGRELAAARAFAGDHPTPELRYWSALYDSRWRRFDDAAVELRAALAVEPKRARYWLALADVLLQRQPVDNEAVDDVITHLLPLANTAHALDFIARYYSERGQVDAGLPFARRAVELERGCWECAETLSVLKNLHRSTPAANDGVYTKPSIF